MEEAFQDKFGRKPRIVITGAESTGKTELSEYLTSRFQGIRIPEYARTYIEQLGRPYNYSDVLHIARSQVKARNKILKEYKSWIFFDTDLIITKVWFIEVFSTYPGWLDKHLNRNMADLYLVCNNDLPWQEDGVRENGGERRDYLLQKYIEFLNTQGFIYFVVTGTGPERQNNAIQGIHSYLSAFE